MAMKIESGIPIPDRSNYRTELTRTAGRMECGQSVVVDTDGQVDSIRKWMRRKGRKIVVRKMDGGWRVWRTE